MGSYDFDIVFVLLIFLQGVLYIHTHCRVICDRKLKGQGWKFVPNTK